MTQGKGFSGRRKQFIKSLRASAHREGTTFSSALIEARSTGRDAQRLGMGYRSESLSSHTRVSQKQDKVIVADELDVLETYNHFDEYSDAQEYNPHISDIKICLLDIAKPAKRRGMAKDFEIIQIPRANARFEPNSDDFEVWENVEQETWEDDWEDDWEEIYDQKKEKKLTYSSVLRGNDR